MSGFLTPRRLALAGLCLLSLVGSCLLAWWQWTRFESATGTFQNLGYVLQWPLFGLFPAFMIYRIRKLRRAAAAEASNEATEAVREPETAAEPTSAETSPEPQRQAVGQVPAPRPAAAGITYDDEDEELAAYNRYLAELHARDQENR